jgi:uncharacterized protein YkwD
MRLYQWLCSFSKPSPIKLASPPNLSNDLLTAINNERTSRGLTKLRLNPKLVIAANRHAQWMTDNNIMSHIGVDGNTVLDRTKKEKYYASAIGENISFGYLYVASIIASWMASGGHRRNMLCKTHTEIGITEINKYWCVIFADRSGSTEDVIIHYSGPLHAPLSG